MFRKKISYLQALTTDLRCWGTENSLSGAPDTKFTKSGSPLCCGEMSSWTCRGQPLMGNLLNRTSQRHVHFSMHGNSQWPQCVTSSLCLRMLLHLPHCLDRVHSDLKQHLIRGVSAHNMLLSRVKAQYVEQCQGSAPPQWLPYYNRFIPASVVSASNTI